jgi:hypothetical protein
MIVNTSHPDIWIGLAREEAHVSKQDMLRSIHASVGLRNEVRTVLYR